MRERAIEAGESDRDCYSWEPIAVYSVWSILLVPSKFTKYLGHVFLRPGQILLQVEGGNYREG